MHRDPAVQPILRDFGARGLAVGRHVLVDPRLDDDSSRAVLRHELTHVAQAGAAEPRLDRPLTLAPPDAPHEREARSGATSALSRIGPNVVSRDQDPPGTTPPAFCTNCHMSNEDIEWRQSHYQQKDKALAVQQKGTLQTDIVTTEQVVVSQRMAMFAELPDDAQDSPIPIPVFPKDLGPQWVAARASVELLNAVIPSGAIPLEVSVPSRTAFATYFRTLLQATDAQDKWEESWSQPRRKKEAPPTECQGSCHTRLKKAEDDLAFDRLRPPPPPPLSPQVNTAVRDTAAADTAQQWQNLIVEFNALTGVMDKLLVRRLPASSKAVQNFQYATDLLERQQQLAETMPDAVRLPGVFYQQNTFEEVKDEQGRRARVAKGIPWTFYLTQNGETWTLKEMTSPKGFTSSAPISAADKEALEDEKKKPNVNPPHELFESVAAKLQFPLGILYWSEPDGSWGQHFTASAMTLSEFLTALGMGVSLALLGLLAVGTGGAGLFALGLVAAGLNVAGTLAGLDEKKRLDTLTEEDVDRAYLTIGLDIVGALAGGLGRIATVAAETAEVGSVVARMGMVANRLWLPVRAAQLSLEAVNIYVITDDIASQVRIIMNSDLDKDQKEKALAKVIGLGVLTLGVQTWSLRGGIKELRAGSPLQVITENGRMRIVQPGEVPGGKSVGELEPSVGRLKAVPETPTGPPPPPGTPLLSVDEDLPQGKVVIDSQYDVDGKLASTSIRYAKGASQVDIDIHKTGCKLLEQESGLEGRLRRLIAKIRLAFAADPSKGVHLQVEIWKHRQMLQAQRAILEGGTLTGAQMKEVKGRIAVIEAQLDDLEKIPGDPKRIDQAMKVEVATEGEKPPGYPSAPEGMYYEPIGDRFMLRPRAGYKGPTLDVEFVEGTNQPTGVLTNTQALAATGVVGQPLSQAGVKEALEELGYKVGKGQIKRPPGGYLDKKGTQYMQPLTVEKTGNDYIVKISEKESFADYQARLESVLDPEQLAKLAKARLLAKPSEQVLVVEGIVDTNVMWKDVLGPKQLAQLEKILTEPRLGNMTEAQAQALIDGLMDPSKGTIKVIIGTRAARESFAYRSQFAADTDRPIAEGIEIHHFDPLYLGGGHKLLAALNADAHDAVHHFFEELRLPARSSLGDVSLSPNSIRAAAKPLSRPAALVVGPTGEVTYQSL